MVQQLVATEGLSGVAQEALEQGELTRAEIDGVSLYEYPVRRLLEADRAIAEHGLRSGRRHGVTATQRAHPRGQLGEGERLDQVVIGTGVETGDAVGHGVTCGEHEDGDRDFAGTQRPSHVQATHVWQSDIEDDDIKATSVGGLIQRLPAGRGDIDDVPLLPEQTPQEGAQTIVVLDQKHVHGHSVAGAHERFLRSRVPQTRPMSTSIAVRIALCSGWTVHDRMAMDSLERLRGLLAGDAVDRLPVQPLIMQFAARHAGVGYNDYVTDGRRLAEAQMAMADDYGIDCLMQCSDPARELIDIAGGDDSSVEWAASGPAIVESRALVLEKGRLGGLRVPDPLAPGRMRDRVESIEMMRQSAGPGASIVGWVEGPLALAAEMRGLSRLMLDTYEHPGFLDELLDFTSQVARAYWEPQVEAGADTIGMSDAAASMMSPAHYERFIFPAQLRVVEDIKSRRPEVIVRLHMCGRTDDLLPTMLELPVDIYELDFPVDLVHARAVLGPEAVILGNVNTVEVMLTGTPEEVYAAAAECHRVCGPNHVVGTGCEVAPETPPENLRALVAYARDHAPGDVPAA